MLQSLARKKALPPAEGERAVTTAVVLVAAAISPQSAWELPILRLIDTAVRIAVGLVAVWIARRLAPADRPAGDDQREPRMRASSR